MTMRKADQAKILRIEHDSDGWWVILKNGWTVEGCHAIVEDRKSDALGKLSLAKPCQCEECQTSK